MRYVIGLRAMRTAGAVLAMVAIPAWAIDVAGLTPDSTYSAPKSASGSIAKTDPALLGRTDSTPINVLIKYDFDPTASYGGGAAGLAPTSPAVTRKKLKHNQDAVRAYEGHAEAVSSAINRAVIAAVPGARVSKTYTTVYGGVAAQVPANAIGDLLKVPGVVAVQQDTLEHPQTSVTPVFTGAANVWPLLGGQDNAASNVVVGIIDTGIWPEHPSFENKGLPPPPGGPYACQFSDGSDTAHLGPAFACNRKLVGAYAFTQTYMAVRGADSNEFCNNTTKVCSARDSEGHGTHTSSTAAGDRVDVATLYGVDRGPISGMAPGARVIMYRVCLSAGCFSSDSVAAVQQAIHDDVDVINFSISGGANPYTDPVELAFLDAFNAGISVNASAGNSGPGAGTVDHGGPWVTTVGASTSNRFFTTTLHLTADAGATFDMPGVTITTGISSPTPVVLAQSLPGEDALCQTALASGAAAGKIVMCQRGVNARVDKGFNVVLGGAAGMILYNPVAQDVETDNHWLPAVHVDGPSTALLAFVNGHTNVNATWVQGTPSATQGDVMAAFSSRGPQVDFIKPDVTAPGIQVLAGMTPAPNSATPTNGPAGFFYQAIAGTSMSSPHAAGISALLKAAHPDWTPAMIKSALMTTAVPAVKEDGLTPATPFDDGAGSIRADRALNATLVFDETYSSFVASGSNPLHRIDLNIASVNAPTMSGLITTRRTAINVSGKSQQLEVTTQAADGVQIFVSDKAPGPDGPKADKKIQLPKNGTTDIWISISAPEVSNGQYFGSITLDPKKDGYASVTIPVAFVKRQGVVTLSHDCAPTTFVQDTGSAACTARVANFASVPANVSLTVTNVGKGKLDFSNISPPATAINHVDGVQWSGVLTPVIAPQVTAITPGTGPAGGYLALSLFGIAPIAGVGDDTITNFNVPTFYYGAEPYTRIGVVSNGYVVIGGGTSADIVFTPQTFPNAARPNNVVALFWTDLNPPAAGAIRIATLTDGSSTWLVVDWDHVRNFGNATTHTGEIWFRLATGAAGTGPSSEQITLSYGVANSSGGDPDSGINWGAENRDGTSGKNIPSPGPADNSEYVVTTSPPTPGGSATITFDASSRKPGTYESIAGMTSNVTAGTTEVVEILTVTR
jgi:hypothetical protein